MRSRPDGFPWRRNAGRPGMQTRLPPLRVVPPCVAHYNQVLREQLSELRAEIQAVIAPFLLVVPHSRNFTADIVDRALSEEVARVALCVEQIKVDLEDFKDPKKLGAALEGYQPNHGIDASFSRRDGLVAPQMPPIPR